MLTSRLFDEIQSRSNSMVLFNGIFVKRLDTLKKLKGNKDLVITHPDKGNGVVIINRKGYDNVMYE